MENRANLVDAAKASLSWQRVARTPSPPPPCALVRVGGWFRGFGGFGVLGVKDSICWGVGF